MTGSGSMTIVQPGPPWRGEASQLEEHRVQGFGTQDVEL